MIVYLFTRVQTMNKMWKTRTSNWLEYNIPFNFSIFFLATKINQPKRFFPRKKSIYNKKKMT